MKTKINNNQPEEVSVDKIQALGVIEWDKQKQEFDIKANPITFLRGYESGYKAALSRPVKEIDKQIKLLQNISDDYKNAGYYLQKDTVDYCINALKQQLQ